MTKFHEIRPLHPDHKSCVVEANQLENYVGDYLVWDVKSRVYLTYGMIYSVRQKKNYTIVDVYVRDWYGHRSVRHSLPSNVKVVVKFAS